MPRLTLYGDPPRRFATRPVVRGLFAIMLTPGSAAIARGRPTHFRPFGNEVRGELSVRRMRDVEGNSLLAGLEVGPGAWRHRGGDADPGGGPLRRPPGAAAAAAGADRRRRRRAGRAGPPAPQPVPPSGRRRRRAGAGAGLAASDAAPAGGRAQGPRPRRAEQRPGLRRGEQERRQHHDRGRRARASSATRPPPAAGRGSSSTRPATS